MNQTSLLFDDCPECPKIKTPRSMFDLTMAAPEVMDSFNHFHNTLKLDPYESLRLSALIAKQNAIIEKFEAGRSTAINYKLDMYELFEKGMFGNRQVIYPIRAAKTWYMNTERFIEDDVWKTEYNIDVPYKLWALRYKKPGHRKWSKYNLEPYEVWIYFEDWVFNEGANPNLFNLTPMMPDDKIAIQGEISRSDQFGWMFRLSTTKSAMNLSLGVDPSTYDDEIFVDHINGPSGWLRLKAAMDPQSYSDIQELFETYPDATVEFSTYTVHVGDCPGRNTLIWEVRNY